MSDEPGWDTAAPMSAEAWRALQVARQRKALEEMPLSTAERYVRDSTSYWDLVVMANYTRLQAVERAAAELDRYWRSVPSSWRDAASDAIDGYDNDDLMVKFDRLRALLTAAGPHQTGPENSNENEES